MGDGGFGDILIATGCEAARAYCEIFPVVYIGKLAFVDDVRMHTKTLGDGLGRASARGQHKGMQWLTRVSDISSD